MRLTLSSGALCALCARLYAVEKLWGLCARSSLWGVSTALRRRRRVMAVHARSARMASAAAQVDAWGGCIRGGGLGGAVGGRTDATDGETDHNRHAWVHGCARGGRRRVWRELAGGLAARRCQRAVSRGRGPRAVWISGEPARGSA